MKKTFTLFLLLFLIATTASHPVSAGRSSREGCFIGAFISDAPDRSLIDKFKEAFKKRPALIVLFVDWSHFPNEDALDAMFSQEIAPLITWEPWDAISKNGINPDAILSGQYDEYIRAFAKKLELKKRRIYLRFAHEMNGDWYPWSGAHWGPEKYIQVTRYIHRKFNDEGVREIRWIFSINAENVPATNHYFLYYPGDRYVDYIGLDGYNWGETKSWSRWRSFKNIFQSIYLEIIKRYKKPVIITEFASTSKGGDKAVWIREAMREIKKMSYVRYALYFNIDKETDWAIPPKSREALEFKRQLMDDYFLGA